MIVYIHRNRLTNQIFYVGIGLKEERANKFKGKQRNQYWHNYVSKYGEPIVEIIAEFETRQEAVDLEMKLIKKYGRRIDGSGILVNITLGGDGGGLGVKQSDETKEKRAVKLRGFVHTEQSKRNMKEAQNREDVKEKHSVYKNDPEWRKMQRNLKLGRKLSEETKAKISRSNKGRIITEETRQKIRVATLGKKRTDEQRLRISQAQIGKKRKPESILKGMIAHYKPVLNTATGIYYDSLKEAAASIPMNINTFRCKMSGNAKNNTPFVYA